MKWHKSGYNQPRNFFFFFFVFADYHIQNGEGFSLLCSMLLKQNPLAKPVFISIFVFFFLSHLNLKPLQNMHASTKFYLFRLFCLMLRVLRPHFFFFVTFFFSHKSSANVLYCVHKCVSFVSCFLHFVIENKNKKKCFEWNAHWQKWNHHNYD